jgi:hypothetical protein
MRKFALLLLIIGTSELRAQISFFNMPNPDMLPANGYAYAEYDRYQSLRGNSAVNANVFRLSVQATPFLEVGSNLWFNEENTADPDKLVLATKWRIWLFKNDKIKLSLSPGSWSSVYLHDNVPVKNLVYTFLGFSIQHNENIYTRVMLGGYGKHWQYSEEIGLETFTSGLIAGAEQRLSKKLVFVTDYFQGSGEGFGLATGFVFYALKDGQNLPIYLAYQFDNDSRDNDLLIFEIGYTFNFFGKK